VEETLNTVIVGAGVVGLALAEQLSSEGHSVGVVDKDRKKIQSLNDTLDVLGVCGNAGSPSILDRAGIRSAEMVIAVTDVDEVNLVVGMLSSRIGVKHRIVRIRNREYVQPDSLLALGELGIDHVINPEPTIVQALQGMIDIPGTTDYAILAGGQVLMLGFDIKEDSPVIGKSMAELHEIGDLDAFLFLYITRGDNVIVPKGRDRIQPGDSVHLLVSADTVKFVLPIIHRRPLHYNAVIISGASRISINLARAIQDRVERIFMIEPDADLAEEVAGRLPKVTVLQGDPTDLDLLTEAGLDKCDLFCALSNNDQKNMLSSLLVKKHSKALTAVLVQQPEYVPVLDSLGVEIVMNPRLVTVGEILMHIRRGHVHSVTRLAESRAEIIEMEVPEDSPVCKSALKDLKFPEDALVGAIVRNGMMRIPTGNSHCEPGDIVLLFALPNAIARIEKLFNRRKWF
jgi:trk system potassium uptake protein TrkA